MKIKDMLQFLPYSTEFDGAPKCYDVDIWYNTDKGKCWCGCERDNFHPSTKPEQLDLTIKKITAGVCGFGGSFYDDLAIFVEEQDIIRAHKDLVEAEDAIYDKHREEEQDRRDREEFERLKRKYNK